MHRACGKRAILLNVSSPWCCLGDRQGLWEVHHWAASPEKLAITCMSHRVLYPHAKSCLPNASAMVISLSLSASHSTCWEEGAQSWLLIRHAVKKIPCEGIFLKWSEIPGWKDLLIILLYYCKATAKGLSAFPLWLYTLGFTAELQNTSPGWYLANYVPVLSHLIFYSFSESLCWPILSLKSEETEQIQ